MALDVMNSTQLSAPTTQNGSTEEKRDYACTTCTQRKVKCDRREPCLACVKSRLVCTYRATPPPQRRKRRHGTADQASLDRTRSHPDTLSGIELSLDPFSDFSNAPAARSDDNPIEPTLPSRPRSSPPSQSNDSTPTVRPSLPHRAILVPEHGGLRYYEHGLIGALGQEFRQSLLGSTNRHPVEHAISPGRQQETSDMLSASVLSGSPSALRSGLSSHPPAAAIARYWSIFLENVQPLTQIIHVSSMQSVIFGNAHEQGSNEDALRFSIYACAVASLTPDECLSNFGLTKKSLLEEFQSAARTALSEACFLRVPDIDLLRAHALLLTSMLHTADPSSLWILMGSAMRMASSQGLHRDGTTLGLSPFETEMRRRLWWYIVTLDERLAELVGSESSVVRYTDTALPSSLNDGDLFPGQASLPKGRAGASEMTFCLVKYEIALFMRQNDPRLDKFEYTSHSHLSRPAEKREVSSLECFLEEKFLRFCDPVIPIHFLTTITARSMLCKLKQMEHRRQFRPSPENERSVSLAQTKTTLAIAARNLEYDNLIHNMKSLRKFLWHVHLYFPWGAPIVVLKVLSSYSEWDADMLAAWYQIIELHEHHQEFRDDDKVLHLILAGLTLKAWAAHVAGLEVRMIPKPPMPAVLQVLQHRQNTYMSGHNAMRNNGAVPASIDEPDFVDWDRFDLFDLAGMTFDGIDC